MVLSHLPSVGIINSCVVDQKEDGEKIYSSSPLKKSTGRSLDDISFMSFQSRSSITVNPGCNTPPVQLATVLENLPLVYDSTSQTLQRRVSVAGDRPSITETIVSETKMQVLEQQDKPTFKRGHIRRSSYESAQIRLPIPATSPAAVARANSLNRAAMLEAASCSVLGVIAGNGLQYENKCSASAASIETGQTGDSALGESLSSKRSSLDRKSQSSFVDWSSDGADGNNSPRNVDDESIDDGESSSVPVENGQDGGKQLKNVKRLGLPSISLPRGLFSRNKQSPGNGTAPWRLFTDHRRALKDASVVSSTGLILETRPSNLPAKSEEEQAKHRAQHQELIEAAKKKEAREAKERKRAIELQRRLEDQAAAACHQWKEQILPKWDEMKNSKRCRELWWQGIPAKVRGRVWSMVIGNDLNLTEGIRINTIEDAEKNLKNDLNLTEDLYEICCARAQERLAAAASSASDGSLRVSTPAPAGSSSPSASSVNSRNRSPTPQQHPEGWSSGSTIDREGTVELVHLDVSRTFPQLGIFQDGGPYYDLLLQLLGAYVCYRPDVGYVQSMSFVAAVLLLQMDPYDAFVAFANLLNRPLQLAFFRLRQPQMTEYFIAYDQYFEQELPRLHAHFDQLDVRPDLYLIEWVYTLYAKSLPLDVTCRVWDMFLRDGEEFLFKTALGILRTFERQLLEMEFDDAVQFLAHLPDDLSGAELFRNIEPFMRSYASTAETAKCKRRFLQILADVNERINPSHSPSVARRPSGNAGHDPGGAMVLSQVAGMKMSKSLSGFLGDLLRPPPMPPVTVNPVTIVASPKKIIDDPSTISAANNLGSVLAVRELLGNGVYHSTQNFMENPAANSKNA